MKARIAAAARGLSYGLLRVGLAVSVLGTVGLVSWFLFVEPIGDSVVATETFALGDTAGSAYRGLDSGTLDLSNGRPAMLGVHVEGPAPVSVDSQAGQGELLAKKRGKWKIRPGRGRRNPTTTTLGPVSTTTIVAGSVTTTSSTTTTTVATTLPPSPTSTSSTTSTTLVGSYDRTFYVNAGSGSDSRSVGEAQSSSTPWRTLGKAIASAAGGDLVIVEAGDYTADVRNQTFSPALTIQGREGATLRTSFDNAHGLTFIGFFYRAGGSMDIEDSSTLQFLNGVTEAGFDLDHATQVVFDGMELRRIERAIRMQPYASHITIRNSNFHNLPEDAIQIHSGDDILVENNLFWDIGPWNAGETWPYQRHSDVLQTLGEVHRLTFRGNTAINNEHVLMIQTASGPVTDVLIEDNYMESNGTYGLYLRAGGAGRIDGVTMRSNRYLCNGRNWGGGVPCDDTTRFDLHIHNTDNAVYNLVRINDPLDGSGGPPTTTTTTTTTPPSTSTTTTTSTSTTTTTTPTGPPPSGGVGVIFTNDFNDDPTGTYTTQNLAADWNNPPWNNGVTEGRVSIVNDPTGQYGQSLRVLYPEGVFGPQQGGAQWKLDLGGSYDELFLSYRIRMEPGFNFVRTGKLPGFCGGACNTGGSPPNGLDGWSARQNWNRDGLMQQYVYYPDQPGTYAVSFRWGTTYQPGQWQLVEHRIVMNTPGQNNGTIQTWVNGQPALNQQGLRFRDTTNFGIDTLHFSTFFGGGDPSFNAARNEYIYFDDFIISTNPITH